MGNDLAELLEPTEAGDKEEVVKIGEEEGEVKEPEVKSETPEVEAPEVTETAKVEDKAYSSLDEQNRELRQILRAQKRDIQILQAKLDRVEKRSAQATKVVEKKTDDYTNLFGPEEGGKEETPPETQEELSQIELVQRELSTIAQVKGPILDTLVEVMEMNPKYSDVREICSQSNFQDMFDSVGEAIAAKEGKDPSLAALEVETAVWKMPNPYKYMYDLIKQYHPRYAGKQEAKAQAAPVAKQTPTSLANVPGKTTSKNAWTAARIDELDEMELNSVPADIYDKYLKGELD